MRYLVALLALMIAADASAASRIIVRMDAPVNVYVDGQALKSDAKGRRAIIEGLEPGVHEIRIVSIAESQTLHEGNLDILADTEVHTRWTRDGELVVHKQKGWDGTTSAVGKKAEWVTIARAVADVVTGGKLPDLPDVGGRSGDRAQGGEMGRSERVASGLATVDFTLTEGMANVWVDGDRKLDFREAGTKSIQLAAGTHQVELKDFANLKVIAKGELVVVGGSVVSFTFGESSGLLATEGADTWTPQ